MILFLGWTVLVLVQLFFWLARRARHLLDMIVGAFLLLTAQTDCAEALLARVRCPRPCSAIGIHLVPAAALWMGRGKEIPTGARWIWQPRG
jgi:hypothetical protein